MEHSKIDRQTQADIQIQSEIDDFFKKFRIGTLLHRCSIRKRHGYSPGSLLEAIFTLPFIGMNFYRGIAINEKMPFGKDAAYELLKGVHYNWRRLLLLIAGQLYKFFNPLTDEKRETVLILDDSPYDRSRSKAVELLCRVWDHANHRHIKGFRLLTLCWSDGVSSLPVDFALLSSKDATKRIRESQKQMDKRCCAWQRRKEAVIKATDHLHGMVKRALSAGIKANYLVMDSWFTAPANIIQLSGLIKVIGMVKRTPKIKYGYDGHQLDVMAIYRRVRKRPGRAKILANAIVTLKNGMSAKIVFVRDRHKKDWLTLLCTDIELADEEIVRIYGKRWDIEVFFKMAKQHLKLTKEIQCRDYDALIAHTSIVFIRYMFIAWQCRSKTDHRTFGDLFYVCCDEIQDISFVESLYRILTLAVEELRELGTYCEKTAQKFFSYIIDKALDCAGLSKNKVAIGIF